MKKSELKQRLINENITKDAYSLEGGLPNEVYCLNQNGGVWEVYYSERGQKSGLKSFAQENEACDYFYRSLISMLQDMGLR
jgi:hypothetical protein